MSEFSHNKLSKQVLHEIYYYLYDQKEDYREIIEVITKTGDLSSLKGRSTTDTTSQTANARIREFEPFKIFQDSENLILGSSITARLKIQSYRSSSTEEKKQSIE